MKVSGAFFYENIWRNKIVPGPKVQTDGTGNYFTAHPKNNAKNFSTTERELLRHWFSPYLDTPSK